MTDQETAGGSQDDLDHLPMLYPEIVDEAMRSQTPVTEVRDIGEHRTIYRAVQYDPNAETVWRADIDADEHPEYDNEPNVKFAKCYPHSDLEMLQEWTSKATGALSGPQKLGAWESMFTVFNAALGLYQRETREPDRKLATDGGQPVEEESAGGQQPDGFEVTGRCRACGTMLGAVSEDAWDRMMASHVLDKHAEEAPEHLLEEARERLGDDDE